MNISRGIWYYDLDDQHGFSCRLLTVRYNLIAMAWVMANNFPSDVCLPGASRFVNAFVEAWVSDLDDTGSLKTRSFELQEQLLKLWKEDAFDLLQFNRSQEMAARRAIKKIARYSLPPELKQKIEHTPERILTMRRDGDISGPEFNEFGPSLILHHVMDMSEIGDDIRAEHIFAKGVQEQMMAEDLKVAIEKTGSDPNRHVPWTSPLVKSLLCAVPDGLEHPKAIK